MPTELKRMYLDDQATRQKLSAITDAKERITEMLLASIDEMSRLSRVFTLYLEGQIQSLQDHLCAAVILQHGPSLVCYRIAHMLAMVAVNHDYKPEPDELDPRWLAAAAFDRWLVATDRQQLFGTQYDPKTGERFPVDPEVTNEERQYFNVRPLSDCGYKPLCGYGAD